MSHQAALQFSVTHLSISRVSSDSSIDSSDADEYSGKNLNVHNFFTCTYCCRKVFCRQPKQTKMVYQQCTVFIIAVDILFLIRAIPAFLAIQALSNLIRSRPTKKKILTKSPALML